MQKKVVLVFPHQLFEEHPLIDTDTIVYLVEDDRFFTDFTFHKQKLILHRATMKMYEAHLKKRCHRVHYVDYTHAQDLWEKLKHDAVHSVTTLNPVDHTLEQKLIKHVKKAGISLTIEHVTPYFVTPPDTLATYFKGKKRYFHAAFYTWQRKRMKILLNSNGSPMGGKWSFDTENRAAMPNTISIPEPYKPRANAYLTEARKYVEKHFQDNPGETHTFLYPTTFKTARAALDHFLHTCFAQFGTYQDAIVADQPFLFHSMLSAVINCGLLTPAYVVEETISYARRHKLPLNTVEGFIRQIIGWREFVWGVYVHGYDKQKDANYFRCTCKIPYSWWEGTTGLDPVDTVIKRIHTYAYAHHIERLMILGNAMLLHEFKPDEVYKWFMELFIDAYDWVMVPNVYGMSQFADGGLMTTKPYISASAYIKKQSNFKKGEWCAAWDELFWHFLHKHRAKLIKIPRMALLLKRKKK